MGTPSQCVRNATIAQLDNAADPAHPSVGTLVNVTDTVISLTPRFVVGPDATHVCGYYAWVGVQSGGYSSGIWVAEQHPAVAGTGDAGAFVCPADGLALIPSNLTVGDSISTVIGVFSNACTGGPCPTNTAALINLAPAGSHFVVPLAGTGAGGVPTATTALIGDVRGFGTTVSPHSLDLQNSLITLSGMFMQVAPTMASGFVMSVSASATDMTNTMPVIVNGFPNDACVRMHLPATGASIGSVTGVLAFGGPGVWFVQIRRGSDIGVVGAMCP
jgi:hypothetical protein